MNSSIKTLIIEVLLEALWGKKFQVIIKSPSGLNYGKREDKCIGIASKNPIPGELPYRITWFDKSEPLGHIDLTWDEINKTLASSKFSPDIATRISDKWGVPKCDYIIRPLPPETEKQSLTESISLSVSGHDYGEQITNILDLSFWLAKKVQLPLMKKMTEEEKHTIKHDIITPDGECDDKQGIMNVYIDFFPEKWRSKLLGGIEYFLKKRNIKTKKWTIDKSKIYLYNNQAVKTVRIPIENLNAVEKDAAPSISMSYCTLGIIFQCLNLNTYYYQDAIATIPVDDLLQKIQDFQYSDKYMELKSNESTMGDKILYFINKIYEMAKWAKQHGYSTIGGA